MHVWIDLCMYKQTYITQSHWFVWMYVYPHALSSHLFVPVLTTNLEQPHNQTLILLPLNILYRYQNYKHIIKNLKWFVILTKYTYNCYK